MALFLARRGRGLTRNIQINGTLNGEAVVITPDGNDKIRAIIQAVSTAYVTIVSDAPTAAGSSFSKNDPTPGLNKLRLDASDMQALQPGVYTLVIDYFDYDDAQEWKTVDRQVFLVEES